MDVAAFVVDVAAVVPVVVEAMEQTAFVPTFP